MRPTNQISLYIFIIYFLIGQNEAGFLYGEPCSERNTLEIDQEKTIMPTHHVTCVDIRNSGDLNLQLYKNLIKKATTLFAQDKSLERIPLNFTRMMPLLELIDLTNNNIRFFHPRIFHRQKNLITLILNENKVFIPKQRILLEAESLENLHLSNNGIRRLTRNTFAGVPNLRVLILQGNELKVVGGEVFEHLEKLKLLDLSRNKIKLFENFGILPNSLDVFILRKNLIKCEEEFALFNPKYCK